MSGLARPARQFALAGLEPSQPAGGVMLRVTWPAEIVGDFGPMPPETARDLAAAFPFPASMFQPQPKPAEMLAQWIARYHEQKEGAA